MNKQELLKLNNANLPNSKKILTKEIIEKTGRNFIIKLNYNENKFGCSPNVKQKIELKSPNIYPEYEDDELLNYFKNYFDIDKENIYFSNGSDAILDHIPKIFGSFKINANAIIPVLTYARLSLTCEIMNIFVKKIELTNWNIDLNKMYDAIDENTSLIYIVNPNMPTGTYINNNEIIEFIKKVNKKFNNITIILDEAYIEYAIGIEKSFMFDKEIISQFDNVIITRTFSKLYGLASFRIGYCISNYKNIEILKKSSQYLPVCKYSYQAALFALQDLNFYKDIIYKTNIEKNRLYSILDDLNITYIKSFGNFIYLSLNISNKNNKKLENFLLNNYGILIRCINNNGVRITIGTEYENNLLIKGLIDFFKND